MDYDEIVNTCEPLSYRDKLRLSQLLIQLARKEEEIQNPKSRKNLKEIKETKLSNEHGNDITSIEYVIDRLSKLRPSKKKTLLNSIKAMYQFQGGISEKDQESIISKLVKRKFLIIEPNNKVIYLNN
jgi:hypothetical protein